MDPLEALEALVPRWARAAARERALRAERDALIVAGRDAGYSLREIARAAQVDPAWVVRIIQRDSPHR